MIIRRLLISTVVLLAGLTTGYFASQKILISANETDLPRGISHLDTIPIEILWEWFELDSQLVNQVTSWINETGEIQFMGVSSWFLSKFYFD